MKIGVTGGAGFIGMHVVRVARERGHDAVVFDRHGRTVGDCDTFLGDIRDPVAVTEFAAHVDAVVHLAAVLGTQETILNPRPAAETNIIGGVTVLDACRQYRLPLANIAVGNHWMRNTYSTTKRCVERLLEQYRDYGDLPAANVRAVNAFGPGQVAAPPFGPSKVRKIMPAFICRALCDLPIEVYGDGTQVSDMVYVGDVADVLVRTVERLAAGTVPSRTLEVGPAQHMTVNEIAESVLEATASSGTVVHLPMRPGETPGATVTADPTTLRDIGFGPDRLTPYATALARTVDWFFSTKGRTWTSPG